MKTNQSNVSAIHHNVDEKELAAFAKQIDHMAVMVGEGFAMLSAKDRLRTPKPRRMMFQVVPVLVTIAERYGVEQTSITPLIAKMRFIEALKPFTDRARALANLVDDMLLKAQGEAWTEARSLYMQLKGKAAANKALTTELAPVVEAFRVSRKATVAKPPAKSPPVAPSDPKPAAAVVVNGTPTGAVNSAAGNGVTNGAANGASNGAAAHA